MARKGFKFYLAAASTLIALSVGYCAVLANGPDRDIQFVREVPAHGTPEALSQAMWVLSNWTKWFFTMDLVQRVDILGRPFPLGEQTIEKGALIEFHVNPKKGAPRKRFTLLAEVLDYVPGKSVTLRILKDSKNKLTQLFDDLQWKVEILPAEGSLPLRVRGTETARTKHWRARLFSSISERILMHQAFYPDLITLAAITQPQAVNPRPVYEQ